MISPIDRTTLHLELIAEKVEGGQQVTVRLGASVVGRYSFASSYSETALDGAAQVMARVLQPLVDAEMLREGHLRLEDSAGATLF